MRYKKTIIFSGIIALCVLAFFLYADKIVMMAAKNQLISMFPGSVVTIGGSKVTPSHSISVSDLKVKMDSVYELDIKEIKISYSIPSIVRGLIRKIRIGESSLDVNMEGQDAKRLKEYFYSGTGETVFRVEEAELSALIFKVKTRDLSSSGKISSVISPETYLIKDIDLELDSLEFQGAGLENGYLRGNPSAEGAGFYVQSIEYGGAKIEDVSGDLFTKGNMFLVRSFSGKTFDGIISGDLVYNSVKTSGLVLDVKAAGIDMSTFTREMKMKEKFDMTGKVGGHAVLRGNEDGTFSIEGDFATDPIGGVLTIKDTGMMKDMAKRSGESVDILIESLKRYEYTVGKIKLSADSGALIVVVELEGVSGKREFNIILHDILSKKGWRI